MVDYTKRPRTPAQPAQPAQTPPTSGAPVSLSKVTLTKSAPTVSLDKNSGAGGQMRINLNWTQGGRPSGGFFKRALAGNSSVDLDLGCLWETRNGDKGVIQALGNQFGSLHQPPYAQLDGDDRSGQNTGGENLIVNLAHLGDIKRILVFAYIYEGAPNWAAADGVVTMYPQGGAPIEIKLDEAANDKRFCAIAQLQSDGQMLKVTREVQYIAGSQRHVDEAYGWGLNWTAGRK